MDSAEIDKMMIKYLSETNLELPPIVDSGSAEIDKMIEYMQKTQSEMDFSLTFFPKPETEADCFTRHFNSRDFVLTVGKLERTSVNCLHFITDNLFTKVQFASICDPLINEVIILKTLNKMFSKVEPPIFPKYVRHFLDNISGYQNYCQIMQTDVITDLNPLSNILKAPNMNRDLCFNDIISFMEKYKECAATCGLTHNDLHLNNIVTGNNKSQLILIDFGRAHIDETKLSSVINSDSDVYDLFCTKQPTPTTYLIENLFHIKDIEYGYMCDIATLALNTMPYMLPNLRGKCAWLKFLYYASDRIDLHVTLTEYKNTTYTTIYTEGLLWFICAYVIHYEIKLWDSTPFTINIKDIKDIRGEMLLLNGVFNPSIYNSNKDKIHTMWTTFPHLVHGGRRKSGIKKGGNVPITMPRPRKKDNDLPKPEEYDLPDKEFLDKWMKLAIIPTTNLLNAMYKRPKGGKSKGGKSGKKSYKLYVDKDGRKFIKKNKKENGWYLDNNRGRYRYSTLDKTHVYLTGQAKNV